MNRGFSLVEIVIYIGLLSLLMVGVFSSILGQIYLQSKKPSFTNTDYQSLITNYHE